MQLQYEEYHNTLLSEYFDDSSKFETTQHQGTGACIALPLRLKILLCYSWYPFRTRDNGWLMLFAIKDKGFCLMSLWYAFDWTTVANIFIPVRSSPALIYWFVPDLLLCTGLVPATVYLCGPGGLRSYTAMVRLVVQLG